MNCLELINKRARRFKPIWRFHDFDGAFELCNLIRTQTGVPEYTRQKFIEGSQYRIIFHEDWKIAKDEFVNLVFGWW